MTDNNNGVLVVVEVSESQPSDLGLEMLALARYLTDSMGGIVTAVAFSTGLETTGETLIAHGADQGLINDNSIFANFHAESWLPDLSKIIAEVAPAIVLIGHSESGTDLAPRLAFRLDVDVATGCESIEVINGQPHMTRSCFGGLARGHRFSTSDKPFGAFHDGDVDHLVIEGKRRPSLCLGDLITVYYLPRPLDLVVTWLIRLIDNRYLQRVYAASAHEAKSA